MPDYAPLRRDLSPQIVAERRKHLKACDFELAWTIKTAEPSGTKTGFMTEYVATWWYSAPEIMLTFKQYGLPRRGDRGTIFGRCPFESGGRLCSCSRMRTRWRSIF